MLAVKKALAAAEGFVFSCLHTSGKLWTYGQVLKGREQYLWCYYL